MFQHTRRVHTLLAGAAGVTLVLGVGAAVGAVPRPVSTENVAAVHAADAPATPGTPANTAAGAPATDPGTSLPPTTDAPTTAPAPAPTTTSKPAKAAAQADVAPAASTPDAAPATTATSAPAPAPAAASGIAPRVNPTDTQVQAAIQQIATRIPFFAVANVSQARQFGDAVCSAFDSGASYSSVKTQVQSALSQLPMVTIKPADMDFAIRTAVQLFCPGYLSKLG